MAATKKLQAKSKPIRLDLGRVDMCLKVKAIARSRDFYRKLGFKVVEGKLEERWLILTRGEFRLGLFQGYIEGNVINFRGGHVGRIVKELRARGMRPYEVAKLGPDGSGRGSIRDPDGNEIFFDSTPDERAARKRALRR